MKKLAILLATLLFARENPFVWPTSKSGSSTSSAQHSMKSLVFTSKASSSTSNGAVRGKLLYDFGFVKLYEDGKSLHLVTSDRLKRAFMVDSPKKGVFDFAKKRAFRSHSLKLQHSYFKSVAIGAHKSYWRIAIEVDSSCKSKIDRATLTLSCR